MTNLDSCTDHIELETINVKRKMNGHHRFTRRNQTYGNHSKSKHLQNGQKTPPKRVDAPKNWRHHWANGGCLLGPVEVPLGAAPLAQGGSLHGTFKHSYKWSKRTILIRTKINMSMSYRINSTLAYGHVKTSRGERRHDTVTSPPESPNKMTTPR